jgi:hypothetical protein
MGRLLMMSDKTLQEFVDGLNEEQRFALCAMKGCEIETTQEFVEGGVRLNITTKNPVGIQVINGQIMIAERRGNQ